jgi:hypothetical protein
MEKMDGGGVDGRNFWGVTSTTAYAFYSPSSSPALGFPQRKKNEVQVGESDGEVTGRTPTEAKSQITTIPPPPLFSVL